MAIPSEKIDDVLNIVEVARDTGKVKKGINEVTKAIERETAKLVIVANDVSPAELILHVEPLCAEKNIPFIKGSSKEELGIAAGLQVGTVALAVTDVGNAKDNLAALSTEKPQPKTEEAPASAETGA